MGNSGSGSSIEVYQQICDGRLIELCQMGLSIREIASILGSTPKTARKDIDRLGIEPFWKYNGGRKFIRKKYIETEEFRERGDSARAKWLQLHEEIPIKAVIRCEKMRRALHMAFTL